MVETGVGEAADGLIRVVHGQRHAAALEAVDLELLRLPPALGCEGQGQLPLALDDEIRRHVLVAEGVAADADGLRPVGNQAGDVLAHDGLSKDCPVQDVPNGPVGGLVHPFEGELLHPVLVGGDRGALDADMVLLDRLGGLDRDPVVGAVAVLDAEIVVLDVKFEVWMDELLLDRLPDDPGHLVAIQLHDRIANFDLLHQRLHCEACEVNTGQNGRRIAHGPCRVKSNSKSSLDSWFGGGSVSRDNTVLLP